MQILITVLDLLQMLCLATLSVLACLMPFVLPPVLRDMRAEYRRWSSKIDYAQTRARHRADWTYDSDRRDFRCVLAQG